MVNFTPYVDYLVKTGMIDREKAEEYERDLIAKFNLKKLQKITKHFQECEEV